MCFCRDRQTFKNGREKTGPYVGENRESDGLFCAKGFRESFGPIDSSRTAKFQSIRVALSVIFSTQWDFTAMDVSRSILKPGQLEPETLSDPPYSAERIARNLATRETLIWFKRLYLRPVPRDGDYPSTDFGAELRYCVLYPMG